MVKMSHSRENTNLGADQFVSARRTESIDAAAITKLISSTTEQVFGRINIINLIERSNLAVTLVNQNEELMGQACFLDYPNTTEMNIDNWEDVLPTRYKKAAVSGSLNSLFLHLFVARSEYSHGAAKEILTTVFTAVPEVHYIYLIVPKTAYPDFEEEASLAGLFSQVEADAESPGLDQHVLFVCGRDKLVPMLHVRQARVQDHDDLTPIFDRQSDMLNNTYGNFFLAELIEAQDESMQCLVAEIGGTAIGFMSLCTEVNLELLNKCFDLGPLHGLKKPHPEDVTRQPPKEVIGEDEPLSKPASGKSVRSTTSALGDEFLSKVSKEPGAITVQRKYSEEMLDSISDVSSPLSSSSASSVIDKLETPAAEEPALTAEKMKKQPTLALDNSMFVPEFYGEPNAFSIQLFCIDEQYEMRSLDLLREAFSRLPDKEYAVMTVPHLVPEFPLLQKFLRVTPRITSNLSHELYVFHKMGLTEDLVIRDAVRKDKEPVESLVASLTHKDNLLVDLNQYLLARRDEDGTEIRAYVAEVHEQVVGVAIIRGEEDIEYIRSHYNIEDFIYFNHHGRAEHAHLHHFAINPIFNHFTKHFLKEILRKSYKTSLYYPVYGPSSLSKEVDRHSMVTCMNEMVSVRPRRQILYPLDILGDRAPTDRVLQKKEPYALCHINRKLTLEPKVTINARIVVVGASTVALAYLETLVFCPHLKFNNLTLISPHGLPGELGPDPLREGLLGMEHCYNEADHATISLRSWVTVVYGKMTKIDRSKKQVWVNGEKLVSYDHLVLSTGEQHQYPMPTGLNPDSTVDFPPANPNRWFEGDPPKNLFVVNDDYDAAVALFWMEENIVNTQSKGKVVVHGSCLRSYTTIQTLIQLGVTPSDIVHVKTAEEGISCFNNPVVEAAVNAAMGEELGIKVEEGAILAKWQVDGDQKITELTFLTPDGTFTTPCSVLFSYTAKRVDLDAFQAVNNACLVFDGKLVIDSTFHTNDISIRSAGSLTKYQRKYHAEPWTHKNFNSKEVGVELASAMLPLFDPTLERLKEVEEDPLKLMPVYTSPKVQGGVLPGGLHYLHVAKPSLDVPLAIHMMNPEYGSVLSTGEPVGKSTEGSYADNFFRLHLNVYNTVETITCLSKKEIEVSNLLCLYGVHQRFLNNGMQRYKEGLITDFFSYFREAWALAIYHDRFSDFRDEIRELLVNQPAPDVSALENKVRSMIDEDLQLSKAQRKNLLELYADTSVKRAVETRLLSYLSYNYYHLPMYAKPGMV